MTNETSKEWDESEKVVAKIYELMGGRHTHKPINEVLKVGADHQHHQLYPYLRLRTQLYHEKSLELVHFAYRYVSRMETKLHFKEAIDEWFMELSKIGLHLVIIDSHRW